MAETCSLCREPLSANWPPHWHEDYGTICDRCNGKVRGDSMIIDPDKSWQIITGDCLEVMAEMEPGSVDAVVTDPPYGVGLDYASFDDTEDNLQRMILPFLRDAQRIADVVALTPGNKNHALYPRPSWTLAWVVPAGTGAGPWGFTCWQPILVYGKDPFLAAGLGSRPDIIIHTEPSGKWSHPCPKPLGFVKKLIERTTPDNASIIDPFCGSGTTGVACIELGRRFIGIEIDPGYADIARKRCEEASRQGRLDFGETRPKMEQEDLF